ncbi:MAG: hypothetical protein E7517_05890 [Ruminococcaceae bacterium]|nr:hypothetical protein [Oscillospiraceae bacterium]
MERSGTSANVSPFNSAFRIPHSEFRIPNSAFRIPHSEFRIPNSAFAIISYCLFFLLVPD